MRALVLAAGLGTRLKPLTNDRPKPLCPFFGIPFIDLAIHRLSGIQNIAVNTHYRSNMLIEHLNNVYSQKLFIAPEDPIRGTGGAIYPLKPWLKKDDSLVIYNADIISDIDITALIEQHQQNQAIATMVLLRQPIVGKTPIFYDNDRVVDIGQTSNSVNFTTFSGVHILSADFIEQIPKKVPWSIIDTYRELISKGAIIKAYFHSGYWADLGTPKDLWRGHLDVTTSPDPELLSQKLGITSLRQRKKLIPLKFLTDEQSCISINTSYTKALPYQSFVDTHDQTIHQSIDQSLVIASSVDTLGGNIHRKIILDDLGWEF